MSGSSHQPTADRFSAAPEPLRGADLRGALAAEAAEREHCFVKPVLEAMSSGLWVFDIDGPIQFANGAAQHLVGSSYETLQKLSFAQLFPDVSFASIAASAKLKRDETRLRRADGSHLPVLFTAAVVDCDATRVIVNCVDLTDRKRLESRLQTAEKLEAVGQLAAGVAHEVNTPIQFIGDGVRFLKDCLLDLSRGFREHETLFADLRQRGALTHDDEARIARIKADSDADFAFVEAPLATDRTLRGVTRVAEIVRALRAFAHPDNDARAPGDVNSAIRDAAIVATSEYKRVAELVLDLGDLPQVDCNLGELNQVFLNLFVNAAHAIAECGGSGLGTITVRSRRDGDFVHVAVTDTGAGIPEAARSRIFEPFFTTKPLGKGTGQGLALVHTFIEGHHAGQLTFESELGVGTTFSIRLPIRKAPSVGCAA